MGGFLFYTNNNIINENLIDPEYLEDKTFDPGEVAVPADPDEFWCKIIRMPYIDSNGKLKLPPPEVLITLVDPKSPYIFTSKVA